MILLFGFICVAVGFSSGFLVERVVQTRRIEFLQKSHRASLQEQFLLAWQHGYTTALESPLAVKYRYEELFGDQK